MRRRGFNHRDDLKVLAIIMFIGAILLPIIQRHYQNEDRSSCASNLKLIAKGILLYSQDWDKRLPLVKVNDNNITLKQPFGWGDALGPYLTSQHSLRCSNLIKNLLQGGEEKLSTDHNYTDYYFNSRLNGIKQQKINDAAFIIMLGDGNNGTDKADARYSLERLPSAWQEDTNSPLYRHLKGANYAFADGHAKWLKPEKITEQKAIELKSRQGFFTFVIE